MVPCSRSRIIAAPARMIASMVTLLMMPITVVNHGGRLAAAIRPDKSEDLTTLDGEVYLVDRREITEPAREIARDNDRFLVDDAAWRDLQRLVSAAHVFRKQRDECVLQARRFGRSLQIGR